MMLKRQASSCQKRTGRKGRERSSESKAAGSSVEDELAERVDEISADDQTEGVQETQALIQATEDVETIDAMKSATGPVQHVGEGPRLKGKSSRRCQASGETQKGHEV